MFEIGKINKLTVSRETGSGYYLVDEEKYGEVFLPPSLAPEGVQIGQEVDVFLYLDTKEKVIATTQIPYAQVGEFIVLRVKEVQDFGAFLDWGISKDLLIPANEQKIKLREGDEALVRVSLEDSTERVFATSKFGKYLENMDFDIDEGEKVSMVIASESDLGFRVIINKKYLGLIYHSEIFTHVELDKTYDGYVKKIRDDGFIDASLQIQGIKNLDQSKRAILEHLHKFGGKSPLHDKSTPEEIQRILGMSKKTFKNSLGMLYKDRMVVLSKDGTQLAKRKAKS